MDAMLGKIIRMIMTVPADWLGTLCDLLEKATSEEGFEWLVEFKKFLRKEPNWENHRVTQVFKPQPKPTISILEFISTVVVSVTNKSFISEENFKLKEDGGICSYTDSNFKEWFGTKVEGPFSGSTLKYQKLRKAATDMPQKPGATAIIPELGGEAKAETTLTEMHSQMAKQANREGGALLTNGSANIFYIKDRNCVLHAVCVRWDIDGWSVCVVSVEDPLRWYGGDQVFSRDFFEAESSEPSELLQRDPWLL